MAAENKALQDKMDREAKALQEKMKEENEKRSMESKALADRLEEVSIALKVHIYLFVRCISISLFKNRRSMLDKVYYILNVFKNFSL